MEPESTAISATPKWMAGDTGQIGHRKLCGAKKSKIRQVTHRPEHTVIRSTEVQRSENDCHDVISDRET